MELKGNFGSELFIDVSTTDIDMINDKKHIMKWLRSLIDDIGMDIHRIDGKEAILVDTWTPPGMDFAAGTSVSILISSSSITLHTAVDMRDKNLGVLYLNCFSCKDFQQKDVEDSIRKYWDGVTILKYLKIDR